MTSSDYYTDTWKSPHQPLAYIQYQTLTYVVQKSRQAIRSKINIGLTGYINLIL